jgi:hypothetical protein
MVKKNERAIQIKVISDMAKLCNPNRDLAVMSIQKAAKIVNGEVEVFGEFEDRRAIGLLSMISRRQCERYYKFWNGYENSPF